MELSTVEYVCPEDSCNVRFACERTLSAHLRANHPNQPQWPAAACPKCPARFVTETELEAHIEKQGIPEHSCPLCPQNFYFRVGLEQHFDTHHKNDRSVAHRFQCSSCDLVCLTYIGLELHRQQHIQSEGQTPSDGGISAPAKPSLSQLAAAASNLGDNSDVISPTSSMGARMHTPLATPHSSARSTPDQHEFYHLTKLPPPITTTPMSLDTPVADSGALADSMNAAQAAGISRAGSVGPARSGSDTELECTKCSRTHKSKDSLNYHLRTAHPELFQTERKFQCKTCLKVCTTQSGLDYHHRTHLKTIEERRAYKCQECSQVFTVRSTLYRHQRTQHAATLDERKPYKCGFCGKAFASRYNLNRHADTRHPGAGKDSNILK